MVSRNWNAFKTFEPLAQAIAQDLDGRSAILDGEIVRPGPDGRPMFYELRRRRGPFCSFAFNLLWLDGSDLGDRPLLERKRLLRKLLPRPSRAALYLEHFASGTELFRVICDRDMEGVVAKQATAKHTSGSHDLGQNQEPAVQSGGRTRGFFQPPEGVNNPFPFSLDQSG